MIKIQTQNDRDLARKQAKKNSNLHLPLHIGQNQGENHSFLVYNKVIIK